MEAILSKKVFSPKTTAVYVSVIKRLTKLGFKFPAKKLEKLPYIKQFFIDNNLQKASTRLDLLNIVIVLRMIEELPTNKLKDYRTQLAKERVETNIVKMNDVKDKLMSLSDFDAELIKAFEQENWLKFIVNYLMRTFGTRVMDTDAVIVKSKKEMTDENENYLLLNKSKVTWYRNKYKTIKKFGKQTHEITDPEFTRAVKLHGNGRLFPIGQLSNNFKKIMIGKMREGSIFKMLINDAFEKKDTARINELSKSRGTGIGTIKSFYDVNAQPEVIRDI
jgi:hypothetical protein